jgi:hypothetical protein
LNEQGTVANDKDSSQDIAIADVTAKLNKLAQTTQDLASQESATPALEASAGIPVLIKPSTSPLLSTPSASLLEESETRKHTVRKHHSTSQLLHNQHKKTTPRRQIEEYKRLSVKPHHQRH